MVELCGARRVTDRLASRRDVDGSPRFTTRRPTRHASRAAECDYVVALLPATPQTVGLLDGDALAACGARRATLINAGRGTLLTEVSDA